LDNQCWLAWRPLEFYKSTSKYVFLFGRWTKYLGNLVENMQHFSFFYLYNQNIYLLLLVKKTMWFHHLLKDLLFPQFEMISFHCDNYFKITFSLNLWFHNCAKCIEIWYHFLNLEKMECMDLELFYCSIKNMYVVGGCIHSKRNKWALGVGPF
jgi:hypothetical protein